MKIKFLFIIVVALTSLSCRAKVERGTGIWRASISEFSDIDSVNIHYYLPSEGDICKMDVVVTMHGNGRDPWAAVSYWQEKAEEYGVVIIAPEFSMEEFPGSQYLYGGLQNPDGTYRPEGRSLFAAIDAIFEQARSRWNIRADKYYLFGHSAGSQFVHRMLLLHPSERVERAAAANAGWYTFPDSEAIFPYGTGSCEERADIARFVGRDITLLLGDADTIPNYGLRMTPEAVRQGMNRFERGLTFYDYGKSLADSLGVEFGWTKIVCLGIDHNEEKMAHSAADIFFGE